MCALRALMSLPALVLVPRLGPLAPALRQPPLIPRPPPTLALYLERTLVGVGDGLLGLARREEEQRGEALRCGGRKREGVGVGKGPALGSIPLSGPARGRPAQPDQALHWHQRGLLDGWSLLAAPEPRAIQTRERPVAEQETAIPSFPGRTSGIPFLNASHLRAPPTPTSPSTLASMSGCSLAVPSILAMTTLSTLAKRLASFS